MVHIDKPDLTVVLRDDGSNLEDALASLLANLRRRARYAGSIEITDGSVDVVDERADAHRTARIDGRDVQLPAADECSGSCHTWIAASVTVGSQSGDCAARMQWQRGGSSADLVAVDADPGDGTVMCSGTGRGVWVRTCRLTAC